MLIMREEDLNMVAGGEFFETYDDSCRLYKAGHLRENLCLIDFALDWSDCSDKVNAAWEEVGIVSDTHPIFNNEYKSGRHHITREKALAKLGQ